MIFFLKVFFKELFLNLYAKMLGYYTSLEIIPIYNWSKLEEGKLQYLYKKRIGKVPEYFKLVFEQMFYEFEKLDTTMIDKRLRLAYLRSLFQTTKNMQYYNKANFLMAEIKKDIQVKPKSMTLNERVNYIESTFNSIGTIDIHKMSASRFYSLLNLAIEKNSNANT